VKQITHLLIAGSPNATRQMRDYARQAVRRAHARGYTIVVGDNPRGVELAVVQECRRLKTPVIVAGAGSFPRNGGCKHGQYVKVHRDMYRGMGGGLLSRCAVRDRWLADTAQIGLFLWDGDNPDVKAAYDDMVARGKDAHLITFGKGTHHG
jgi:hypothetical protein